jgi:cellulose synthase/poly-beta-1,6-N-acetylglucosamine synthase-like glycosyltransferase
MATEKRWIASFFIVIFVWFGILFSTVYQWANGVEVLIDSEVDLSYVTLPLMGLALVYTLSGIFIFAVYFIAFNRVKTRQQQKFDTIQKEIKIKRQHVVGVKAIEKASAAKRNQLGVVPDQNLVSIISSTPSSSAKNDFPDLKSQTARMPINIGAIKSTFDNDVSSSSYTENNRSKAVNTNGYIKSNWDGDGSIQYNDLCSIIIPSRNEEAVIRKTIQNCLLQTYKNIEVIVVCHNCSDRTFKEATQVLDSRVRPFELLTKEAGKGIALNYGVEKATGDYVLILDGDGRLSNDFIEKAMPLFYTDEEIAGVQGRYVPSNRNYNFITRLLSIEGDLWSTPYMTARSFLNKQVYLGGTGFILKKDVLKAVGSFNNHLVDDYELSCRLFKKNYKIVFAPLSVDYDEKPPSISIMLRQRARWAKGFLGLLKNRQTKASDLLGTIYWLSPIASIAGILVLAIFGYATIHNILFDYYPYKYSYIPLNLWFSLVGAVFGLQFGVIVKEYGRQGMKYAPLLILFNPFSLYSFVTYVKALFVKSWGDTKTAHGFVKESPNDSNRNKTFGTPGIART